MTKLHEIDHPEKKVDKNVVFAHYYMCMATSVDKSRKSRTRRDF